MKKVIRKYVGTGNVEELAMGEGNTGVFGSNFVETEYEVGTTQGKGQYYDEQIMNDPDAINKMVDHMREEMTNDMTRKIVVELGKASHKLHVSAFNFDAVADAIAEFPKEGTDEEGCFLLITRKDLAE